MNRQQLLRTVFIVGVGASLKPCGLACVVRRKRHLKQRVESLADGIAKPIGGVDGDHLGVGGQLLAYAGQAVAKHRKSAGQDVLVEVARAHKDAVATLH
ncbi:hypothetical protein D3C72_1847440 [compost metagenome]